MDIFSIFTLCGGLAFFLYGMQVMSGGLEKLAGGKLEKLLRKITSNPVKSFALGTVITMAIQSSTGLTVMLVGLVNSGIMEFGQTIGVIMGANIGTTFTAWILSLTGIESTNFFLRLLKPESFAPIFALVGICLLMISKESKKKSIGSILLGFSILMSGMEFMTQAMYPLSNTPEFTRILTAFTNPVLGVIVGALFTVLIQSSSASVGILQALSLTCGITSGMAIPIIMGQNLGTCITTAAVTSVGVSQNAKRVGVVHVLFNVAGVTIWLICLYGLNLFIDMPILKVTVSPFGIAIIHTLFNVSTTLILLPCIKLLEKGAMAIVKDKTSDSPKEVPVFLDDRLLLSPSFAISECTHHAVGMADLSEDVLFDSIGMLENYDKEKAEEILKSEEQLDYYEDKLGSFLVKISGKELSDTDSNEVSKLLHSIGDIERIGDYAVNTLYVAKDMNEKELKFSDAAIEELKVLTNAVKEIMEITVTSFDTNNSKIAEKVEPLEQVIDGLVSEIKNRHIQRLQDGSCTIELGMMLSDLLNNFERISDHCSNVAACIIQLKVSSMNRHNYLNEIKTSGTPEYTKEFESYKHKYSLVNS